MVKAKPQYKGRALLPKEFGGELEKPIFVNVEEMKRELRGFYSEYTTTKCVGGESNGFSRADEFIEQLVAAAYQASSFLFRFGEDTTKEETMAELVVMRKIMERAKKELDSGAVKLSKISPAVDRCLPLEAVPLDWADQMKKWTESLSFWIEHLCAAEPKVEAMPKADRPDQKERRVAVELAIDVLRTLEEHGLSTGSYASPVDENYRSDAVHVLGVIGKHIKMNKSPLTWRDIISDAKQQIGFELK